ncbi:MULTISPECIES: hypothetical protein [Loigolactobacillus]|uniref:Uncharacterized protein n=1 Tax=Loigolactobacillus backii TaxID=375175 RepID=A0A192H2Y3_9LACO|nr:MULTISPECIES: hypothetical protein [Loigolactobacillus]ANK59312.1 hypothetical protein AYR52_03050 [Loigolactobacillus backii]ANK62725.1 hypothetical protein AYR53_08165 [Loigolactobacillus backii]ANK64304.1 hypothetical protein AYR54_03050 [Loigolactobacillus backii]ANK67302.1 hypothetical protein AYR55_05995 [Loigolactobacillus backii]ANK70267.1 hypothetical protein AYR56_08840 [Loigolactobacillus backii]
MDNVLTLELTNGKTMTLNEVTSVRITTDDTVITSSPRDFLNIGRAVKYDILYEAGTLTLASDEVKAAHVVEQ